MLYPLFSIKSKYFCLDSHGTDYLDYCSHHQRNLPIDPSYCLSRFPKENRSCRIGSSFLLPHRYIVPTDCFIIDSFTNCRYSCYT